MNTHTELISTPLNRTPENEQMSSVERALNHLDSRNNQKVYEALTIIKKRVTKGAEEVIKFRRSGGIEKLLSIIAKINPKFLEFVLSILNSCCSEENSCYKIAQCDGVNILADKAIKLLTTELLCHRFCRLIGSLAVYDSCRILIHDRPEIIESIVGFLKEETGNEFKQAICKTIRVLSDTEEHQSAVLRWQALKSVTLQLKTGVNDVIMAALKTVAHFLKRCTEECIRQFVSGETIQSLVSLSSKNDNRDIASYSMSLLLRISRLSDFCQYLGSNGALELFIQSAKILMELAIGEKRRQKLRPLLHSVNALCRCCRGSLNRMTMRELGGLNLLVQVLKTDEMAPIFHRVISGLACFVFYEEGLEALSRADVLEVFIQQLYRCIQPNPSKNSVEESGEMEMKEDLDEEEEEAAAVGELHAPCDETAGFPAGDEEMDNREVPHVEFEASSQDAADDEVKAITSTVDTLPNDAERGTSFPRYSIHSPTYQAVLQEQQHEDTNEVNPRNMWEGIELYGGLRPYDRLSPVMANSPLRSSSGGSSPIREVYSPLSMSLESPSGGLSPQSDVSCGDLNRGWSPCFSGSSCLSPVERLFDAAAPSDAAYSPGCSSYDLPSNESEYSASTFLSVEVKMETELAEEGTTKSDSSRSSEEGILADDRTVSTTGIAFKDRILNEKDDGVSKYYSGVFRKNRHYADMLMKYENAFEDSITTATALEECTTKVEKRKRSVSFEALRKIQKTVDGDISRSSRSCVSLEGLTSLALPVAETSSGPKKEISREQITASNILLILSRAYHFGNSVEAFCSRRIVQGLLDYLTQAEQPTKQASELLLRLTENRLCFEILIKNGIPSLFSEVLNPDLFTDSLETKSRDSNNACCSSDDGNETENGVKVCCDEEKAKLTLAEQLLLCEKLYCNLSAVAQTDYGKTVLSYILKKGNQSEREHCVIELCYILRSDAMKKHVLLKLGGLKLLIGILKHPETSLFLPAVRRICCLAKQLSIAYNPSRSKPFEDKASVEHEKTADVTSDVSFVFENGDCISANRAEMAASSSVFAALLQGQFAEAKMSSIPISHTSAPAFHLLIHLVRNEPVESGIMQLNEPTDAVSDVLLDVLRLANHYLMPSICETVGTYLCQNFLDQDNVEEVFNMCVALDCSLTPFQCVTYILSKIPLQQCCQVVANLTSGNWGTEFLQLVNKILSERLISMKESVSLGSRKRHSYSVCTF